MKKIFLLFIFTITYMFAVDASMEIVKKSTTKPTILISSSTNPINKEILEKVKLMIQKDLNISGHFNVLIDSFEQSIGENADYVYLSRKNVDLFLNINFEESAFKGVILKTKLYDVNSRNLVVNKTFSTSRSTI